jgi:hypothetical protein
MAENMNTGDDSNPKLEASVKAPVDSPIQIEDNAAIIDSQQHMKLPPDFTGGAIANDGSITFNGAPAGTAGSDNHTVAAQTTDTSKDPYAFDQRAYDQQRFDKATNFQERFNVAEGKPAIEKQLTNRDLAEAIHALAISGGPEMANNGDLYARVVRSVLQDTPNVEAKLKEIQNEILDGPGGYKGRTKLSIESTKRENGETSYAVKAQAQRPGMLGGWNDVEFAKDSPPARTSFYFSHKD